MSAKMNLRVLYTINGSPQYILARSLSPVSVTLLPQDGHSQASVYSNVSLKTCLDTICRSSPDLLHDPMRDFSLYVLDPLESSPSPTPVDLHSNGSTINTAEKPRGVAVGLGLMSWALRDSEDVVVTGTRVKLATGQEAVEVIFALRETPSLNAMPWNGSSPPLRSFPQGNSNPLQRYSSGSANSTSRSNLTQRTDLKRDSLVSIHMRSKGKSKISRATRQSKTPVTESDKLLSADTYIGPLKKKGRPKATVEVKAQGNIPADSSQVEGSKDVIVIDASDTENAVPTCGGDLVYPSKRRRPQGSPPSTTAPLRRRYTDPQLNTLFDGTDTSVPDPSSFSSHVNATTNTALLAALSAIDSSEIQNSSRIHNESNSALVAALRQLLAVYAQPTTFAAPTASSPVLQTPSPLPSMDKENMNPITQGKSAEKGSDNPSDCLRTSPLQTSSQFVSAPRKRTLSSFMDEKEKGKPRESMAKRDVIRTATVQRAQLPTVANVMRHYPRVLASNLPRVEQPSNYYRTPLEPWTSPIRGKTDKDREPLKPASPDNHWKSCASSPIRAHKMTRRKYVVPEWARTDTAMRPRLSENAQRALKQTELRRREERKARRRSSAAYRPKSPAREVHVPQVRIAPSSSGPVIAFPLASPPISSSSVRIPTTPKTPSRNCEASTPWANESLFTPKRSDGHLDNALISRTCTTITSILMSPLANRTKLKGFSPLNSKDASLTEDSRGSSTGGAIPGGEMFLADELERTPDEADCPPSSLSFASSVDNTDVRASRTKVGEVEGVKQHWVGLPPSSPPPPSSPMLFPASRMDDEDLDDLPIATSDSEADVDLKMSCHVPPTTVCVEATNRDTVPLNLTDEDLTTLFLMEHHSPVFSQASDLFEQFTHINTPSDDTSLPGNNIQTLGQNPMDTLDFAEFWETFNPILSTNVQATNDTMDFGNSQPLQSVDPFRLADEFQALFGGCVM